MTEAQRLWWRQSNSDYDAFVLMAKSGMPVCHAIHYLQMSSEKLAKAYLWKSGKPPLRSHKGFVQFLKMLGAISSGKRPALTASMGYEKYSEIQNWVKYSLSIARELERLAPSLAEDGENPEYPWPHENPISTPVSHTFRVWETLTNAKGRAFVKQLKFLIDEFEKFAHL